MTGREHYVMAEKLLEAAQTQDVVNTRTREFLVAKAQAHATLALAAESTRPKLADLGGYA